MADYVIRSGDTLSALAQRFGTTVAALAQANGIANPDRIQAGATIRVPDPMQPTTGAMPRPRPQQVAQAPQAGAPLPPPNPSRGPVPLPRPRPDPVNSGMGNPAVAQAPMDYRIPIAAGGIPNQPAIPQPGSLMAGQMMPVAPTRIVGDGNVSRQQAGPNFAAAPAAIQPQPAPQQYAAPAGDYEAALAAALREQALNEAMMEADRQRFLAEGAAYRAGIAEDGQPAAPQVQQATLGQIGQLMTGGPPPTDPRNPSLGWLLNMARQPGMQRLGNLAGPGV